METPGRRFLELSMKKLDQANWRGAAVSAERVGQKIKLHGRGFGIRAAGRGEGRNAEPQQGGCS